MKINWGTGIVLSFIGFIAFILFFVVRMSMDDRANHDLVTEEYYKKELSFQKEIDAMEKAKNRPYQVKLIRTDSGMIIQFPEDMTPSKIKGKVSLYRPSNKHLDIDFPISLSNTHLLIPDKRLLDGRWDIDVNWDYEGETYLFRESFTY
ncbi:FixH family protein [Muriicola soli]|uniref:Cytochrome C oxidase Cbb3 n=1 Tax=Muriicola soli TaxID=2507538 RepID=A0A411E6I4_9FLAO|nr:FixH family protein [Muriicola soli]QBA63227.1 cytochrome C oxidase Cbb3 [Muriicola soli]